MKTETAKVRFYGSDGDLDLVTEFEPIVDDGELVDTELKHVWAGGVDILPILTRGQISAAELTCAIKYRAKCKAERAESIVEALIENERWARSTVAFAESRREA